MNGKLKKRGLLALIIYFLMITAVFTPAAFYTGKARGETKAREQGGDGALLSQNETALGAAEFPLSLAMAPQDAVGEASPTKGANGVGGFGPHAPSLKPAALREAVMRAIAGIDADPSGNGGGEDEAPSPFSLAMSPGPSGGVTQGGAVNGGAGYPGAIIPGFLAAATENPLPPATDGPGGEPPGGPVVEEPPVLVTPIPAALPLMLTGFAGLLAAGKRRRR